MVTHTQSGTKKMDKYQAVSASQQSYRFCHIVQEAFLVPL